VRSVRRSIRGALCLGLAAVLPCLSIALSTTPAHADSMPPIKHVWWVLLENQSYAATFTATPAPDPYLRSLVGKGALIPNYYAIAHESLPNYLALIGGQSPTPQTQQDCNPYSDVTPGSSAANGQVTGSGCVYPASRLTLADQLMQRGLTWKGYMEDLNLNGDTSRDPTMTCAPPPPGGRQDVTQNAATDDQYAARHDPFMYYHSIIDAPICKTNVVQLQSSSNGLAHDLGSAATTPNFSFVTPNLCNDGHDPSTTSTAKTCAGPDPCGNKPGVGGYTSIDCWLAHYVPMITNSDAYRADGMLVILFDESSNSDAASCCQEMAGPNTAAPGISGNGGGQVGAVVLSPFVKPGTVSQSPYNHYSLLRTVEDIFHTGGGDDGAGHLGFAATFGTYSPGEFGPDVFTAAPATDVIAPTFNPVATDSSLPEVATGGGGGIASAPISPAPGSSATPGVVDSTLPATSASPVPAWNAGRLAATVPDPWWKGPAGLLLGVMVLFGAGLALAMARSGRGG